MEKVGNRFSGYKTPFLKTSNEYGIISLPSNIPANRVSEICEWDFFIDDDDEHKWLTEGTNGIEAAMFDKKTCSNRFRTELYGRNQNVWHAANEFSDAALLLNRPSTDSIHFRLKRFPKCFAVEGRHHDWTQEWRLHWRNVLESVGTQMPVKVMLTSCAHQICIPVWQGLWKREDGGGNRWMEIANEVLGECTRQTIDSHQAHRMPLLSLPSQRVNQLVEISRFARLFVTHTKEGVNATGDAQSFDGCKLWYLNPSLWLFYHPKPCTLPTQGLRVSECHSFEKITVKK